MALDQVHDSQMVYRDLLHSMSRPGVISDLTYVAQGAEIDFPNNRGIFLLALTLLDGESAFHVISKRSDSVAKRICELTSARQVEVEKADFLFILSDAEEAAVLTAMKLSKEGNLANPQLSTTLIIETEALEDRQGVALSGPGIKGVNHLETGLPATFWKVRNEKTVHFPLGIDMIFIDESSRLACIPRSTKVTDIGVKSWDM